MKPDEPTVTENGALKRGTSADSAAGNKAAPAAPEPWPEGRRVDATEAHAILLDGLGRIMSLGRFSKFRNDGAASEIRIGTREFNCIGASPPHDHPHVYINMGKDDSILCPYCAMRYRYDPRLGPFEADPLDSLFFEPVGVG